jgi:stage V sporulation protein AC
MNQEEQKKIQRYGEKVKQHTPNSRLGVQCLKAFWVGGLICSIGQALTLWGIELDLTEMTAPMFTSAILIFLGTTLTGIGVYDRIGKYAGAGSIVPITGFANSIAAPAIEFRREGLVMGVGAKLFALAGPVLAYGISASVVVGILYWVAEAFFI